MRRTEVEARAWVAAHLAPVLEPGVLPAWPVPLQDILEGAGLESDRPTTMLAGAHLRRLGWTKLLLRRDGRPTRVWCRPGQALEPLSSRSSSRSSSGAGEEDPYRVRVARVLGAEIGDGWARSIRCPRCGASGVSFPLSGRSVARCRHTVSCGGYYQLGELLLLLGAV